MSNSQPALAPMLVLTDEQVQSLLPLSQLIQAIGQAFGGRIVRAARVMHGKMSSIAHRGEGVFEGLASPFIATRYHSLVIDRGSIPACLEVTAESEDGEIMGVRHREFAVQGVQFHPEAILTEHGHALLSNFLKSPQ